MHSYTMRKLMAPIALMTSLVLGNAASAGNFSTTEVQLHHGDGYHFGRNGADTTKRSTITLEHFTAFDNSDIFYFVDLFADHDGPKSNRETGHYGELYYHFGGPKSGLDFGKSGPIRNIRFGGGINHGNDFLVGLVGARASFNAPGFNVLSFGLYAYDNIVDPFDRDLDTTYQATLVWNAPFEIGSQKFKAQGFVDFIGDQGSGVDSQVVFSPQIRWDIGRAFGAQDGKADLGLEYTRFHNKFGVTGVHDDSVSLFLAMRF